MKQLSDRFVVDAEAPAAIKQHENKRKVDVKFEKQKREIVGIEVLHDPGFRNQPLGDQLTQMGL